MNDQPRRRFSVPAIVGAVASIVVIAGAMYSATGNGAAGREGDIRSCHYDAIKVYPSRPTNSSEVMTLIPLCMRAKGYDYPHASRFCPADSRGTSATNPDCYRPREPFALVFFEFETRMRSVVSN